MRNITQSGAPAAPLRSWIVIAGSVVADLAAVAVFVVVGRSSHQEAFSLTGLLQTGWPFLVGVAGGYIGIALTGWPTLGLRGGAVIAVKTLVIGLVLRYGIAGEGTPPSFVIVTTLVLTVLILGWRLVLLALLRRADARATPGPAAG